MLQPASRALLRLTRAAPARGGCGLAWRFETSATRREVSRSMFYITALKKTSFHQTPTPTQYALRCPRLHAHHQHVPLRSCEAWHRGTMD